MPPASVTIHGLQFSDYNSLTHYIQGEYPTEHSQFWRKLFRETLFDRADDLANADSITEAVYSVPQDDLSSLNEIMLKTKSNFPGAMILSKLGAHIKPPSRSGSIGSSESNQKAIDGPELEDLKRAFSSVYIDPHGFAEDVFDTLVNYMDCYCSSPDTYVAPCTSLTTSSMMGKSRLLKQIANHTPLVYICLRSSHSTGYPSRSSKISGWLLQDIRNCFKPLSISRDDSNFFATLKFSAFFEATLDQLAKSIKQGALVVKSDDFSWLWEFFAEPTDDDTLKNFWVNVIVAAENVLRRNGLNEKKRSYCPILAYDYLKNTHPGAFAEKLSSFWDSIPAIQPRNKTPPFLFVFDEARSLCDTDTNGLPILEHYSKYHYTDGQGVLENYSQQHDTPASAQSQPKPQFPHFKALRRALRYTSNKHIHQETARVFGIFTDTTSRITNFQPTSWEESSGRFPGLPDPGKNQFPPIYLFASIDVFSRLHNTSAFSSPEKVTAIPRLLRFGRAGWYSVYQQIESRLQIQALKSSTTVKPRESVSRLIGMAMVKLKNSSKDLVDLPSEPKQYLQYLAVLAPRLALTIGPYNVEAAELVASHLAVLGGTDDERHFLRTYYPSEPFLAEVSAICTRATGWQGPLKALNHYVMGGVVEAGFRGELLTKVTCLMAMDHLLNSTEMDSLPSDQLRFSRVVKVSQFLNSLATPRTGNTFCEMLHGVTPNQSFPLGTLNVDHSKLQTFLNGNVFFNHFVRVEVKLTIPMLVHAWNRGAAIMCQTGAKGIYVIPVILPAQRESDTDFGPLHDEWTDDQCRAASHRVSYILINSRNYESPKRRFAAAWATKLSSKNFEPCQKDKTSKQSETVETLLAQADEESEDENEESDDKKDLGDDCRVENFDQLDEIWNPEEFKMKKAQKGEKMRIDKQKGSVENTEDVFMSLVQDFGNRSKREAPLSIGEILPQFFKAKVLRSRVVEYPQPQPITQFIVVLKGIGPETYQFLRDDTFKSNLSATTSADLDLTRRYLKRLRQTRYDYVENRRQLMSKFKGHKPIDKSLVAIVEGLPLVYNSDRYTSKPWRQSSSQLRQSECEGLQRFARGGV